MQAQLLNGKIVSQNILDELKSEIESLKSQYHQVPGLAVILAGAYPASQVYVASKKRTCQEIGMQSFDYHFDDNCSEAELIELIESLNQNPQVHGILVQLPLPKGLDEGKILSRISAEKDVDGFHPTNIGKLLLGFPSFKSCTPFGIMKILEYYQIDPQGKHVVIIGRSNIVGKPLAAMLIQREKGANATVSICHSQTQDLSQITSQADILVASIGQPEFVTADMVKQGAVVIDVGINRIPDTTRPKGYRIVGDVEFDTVSEKASAITPVPGGVGLMTIAMLMTNTVFSFKQKF